jgi:hypothetical protein
MSPLLLERHGGRRIRFTDVERHRLARKAQALGRKVLNELETLVTPDTLLALRRAGFTQLFATGDAGRSPKRAVEIRIRDTERRSCRLRQHTPLEW